jgi:hypothetical protein
LMMAGRFLAFDAFFAGRPRFLMTFTGDTLILAFFDAGLVLEVATAASVVAFGGRPRRFTPSLGALASTALRRLGRPGPLRIGVLTVGSSPSIFKASQMILERSKA